METAFSSHDETELKTLSDRSFAGAPLLRVNDQQRVQTPANLHKKWDYRTLPELRWELHGRTTIRLASEVLAEQVGGVLDESVSGGAASRSPAAHARQMATNT